MEAFLGILDHVYQFFITAQGKAVLIAGVLDFIFRLFKTDQPLSVAHLLGYALRKLGAVLIAFADLSDKVLPQRLKVPDVPLVIPEDKK